MSPLVGHSGSGKTQLVSALLFDAGAVNRFGKVDDGTTVTDFDEEEIARKHTLSASLAYAEWNKHKINIIDTPGIGNFLSDARAALRVADAALVVVDAVAGSRCRPRRCGRSPRSGLPRMVVVNRMDRDRASLERSLESLQRRSAGTSSRSSCRSVKRRFKGVVDLVSMKASPPPRRLRQIDQSRFPPGRRAAQAAREELIERSPRRRRADGEVLRAGTLTQEELSRA